MTDKATLEWQVCQLQEEIEALKAGRKAGARAAKVYESWSSAVSIEGLSSGEIRDNQELARQKVILDKITEISNALKAIEGQKSESMRNSIEAGREFILRCACGDKMNHWASIVHEPEDSRGNNLKGSEDDWYLTVKLDRFPFWKRVRTAWAFLIGREAPFGDYVEIVLTTDDMSSLNQWIAGRLISREDFLMRAEAKAIKIEPNDERWEDL